MASEISQRVRLWALHQYLQTCSPHVLVLLFIRIAPTDFGCLALISCGSCRHPTYINRGPRRSPAASHRVSLPEFSHIIFFHPAANLDIAHFPSTNCTFYHCHHTVTRTEPRCLPPRLCRRRRRPRMTTSLPGRTLAPPRSQNLSVRGVTMCRPTTRLSGPCPICLYPPLPCQAQLSNSQSSLSRPVFSPKRTSLSSVGRGHCQDLIQDVHLPHRASRLQLYNLLSTRSHLNSRRSLSYAQWPTIPRSPHRVRCTIIRRVLILPRRRVRRRSPERGALLTASPHLVVLVLLSL